MFNFLKKQSPVRIIALGFLATILLGSVLLILPFSIKPGIQLNYIDALYTSTSAVCVTGLIAVDVGTTFTTFGQIVLAVLIQVGGLGVTTIGAGIILAVGKKMNLKGMNVLRETSSAEFGKGFGKFVRDIFVTTVIIELIGALLSFIVFSQDMPLLTAIGVSLFHSIASFNNSGFDILGGVEGFNQLESLIPYQNNLLLNFTTCLLIVLGGLGFLVIREIIRTRFKWKKFSMHTKVVLVTSAVLIVVGTVLLKLTEDISWLGAFFFSVSARTAGFATYSLGAVNGVGGFNVAGLLTLIVLMFIGASSGSTGGGIKTTTFFVLLQGIKSSATKKSEKAFKYAIPKDAFKKAAVIALLATFVIVFGSYLISIFETSNTSLPNLRFIDVLFEVTSAFGTVGLSTGITPNLTVASKITSILIMYIGRLGPLTVASLWQFAHGERFSYPEGNISIG